MHDCTQSKTWQTECVSAISGIVVPYWFKEIGKNFKFFKEFYESIWELKVWFHMHH